MVQGLCAGCAALLQSVSLEDTHFKHVLLHPAGNESPVLSLGLGHSRSQHIGMQVRIN